MSKIAIVGSFTATPGNFDTFLAKMTEHARASRAEPGCLRFDVSVPQKADGRFFIYEIWADQKALDVHANTARIKAYREETKPLQAERNVTMCTLHDSADL